MRRALVFLLALAFATPTAAQSNFKNQSYDGVAITKSDTVFIPQTWGIFNGNATACIIQVTMSGPLSAAAPTVFNSVQPGTILPIQVIKVWSTTTTCTNMVALY